MNESKFPSNYNCKSSDLGGSTAGYSRKTSTEQLSGSTSTLRGGDTGATTLYLKRQPLAGEEEAARKGSAAASVFTRLWTCMALSARIALQVCLFTGVQLRHWRVTQRSRSALPVCLGRRAHGSFTPGSLHRAGLVLRWRSAMCGALAALLLWSAPAAAFAAAAGDAPAAAPRAAAPAGAPAVQQGAPAARGADEEPHSWLLKWRDPAQAKPLPGTRVLRRLEQPAAPVDVVRPADPGTDTSEWLRRLRETPGVEYVQPNSRVSLLSASPNSAGAAKQGSDVSPLSAATPDIVDANKLDNHTQLLSAATPDIVDANKLDNHTQLLSAATPGIADANKLGNLAQSLTPEAPRPARTAKPDSRVTTLSASSPNDPALPKQRYLEQIGAKEAWAKAHEQTALTIALVDTGVDLNHPDLKGNLVEGTNLVHPNTPPEDDNGHGTEVAGVLAGIGDNKQGIAGILWRAKIMPVKALDADGYGDEERLGEAIMYAVKKGAKIIVLSVGLYRYSPYLKDIVDYADAQGVLLVAASGNDGLALGPKAKVKYPAAYPTVLAVGGAAEDGRPEPRSNKGPEIDLIAPWNVYTTAVGGGYKHEEGTSMSAPQAAAAAALVWAVHPDFKPYQVRALLRQTAKDTGSSGVDDGSGYGLLQIGRAVTQPLKPDPYEPNERRDDAGRFPLGTQIMAQLGGGADKDRYRINAPDDGVISLQLQGAVPSGESMAPVQITQYAGDKAIKSQVAKLGSQTLDWNVKKGPNDFELQFYDNRIKTNLPYRLTSAFTPAPDAYETNDKPYQAHTLLPKTQTITGNFHKVGDRDWFVIRFKTGGTLKLTLSTDSVRIDPALSFQRAEEPLQETDENGEGETEVTPLINIKPGTYYFEVRNAISAMASPTVGHYQLDFVFRTKYTDPNEPNDKYYEATGIRPGANYVGVIGSKADADWYQLRLSDRSAVRLNVTGIPEEVRMSAEMLDKKMKPVNAVRSAPNRTAIYLEKVLDPGVYYIKVTADTPFDKQYYGLRIDADRMVAGFRDISGHWAESDIAMLARLGLVAGSGNYRFEPNRSITRAEAVTMLVNAYDLKNGSATRYRDVPAKHWAYSAIASAVNAGWVKGYPDGTFRPNRPITREEMAAMLVRALNVAVRQPASPPFADVEPTRWSAGEIAALKNQHIAGGYPDFRFRPEQLASRAEFAAVLLRVLNART